ncbi:unnamed protein product [Arctogadus glacialis]
MRCVTRGAFRGWLCDVPLEGGRPAPPLQQLRHTLTAQGGSVNQMAKRWGSLGKEWNSLGVENHQQIK